ncbi:lytic transglycosylase domain-containing protein [Mucilaginibacter gotjawali]|jgi:membrane-bound lytic murein transglycosylase D|nr:lytic transglycosylase domain-containing protein [Mucilaginibacter gotjawali]
MIKKEMTKKHLITCSVIIVLVIISTLNIYSAMGSKTVVEPAVKPVINVPALAFKTVNFVPKSIAAENDFSFANEALPINDASVKRKLQRSLVKHNFRNVRTNILQTKALQLFPIIEPILKAYGIPDDFKYIPLVESGLCEGTSARGAKGIWQFMPGTARTYGLKVRDGVDERMNTRKSTIAACKYIKELYVEFNSWTLAAAAYNNGENQIERAINRQNEDNYFLMHLNGETAAYVYNIIAMKQIISQPGKYGYKTYLKPNELFAYN